MRSNDRLQALGVALALFMPVFSVSAQNIGPAQEQELRDARTSLEAARKKPVDKFAAAQVRQAQESLLAADDARTLKDAEKFSRSARLARAYAELAAALAELGIETENLAASSAALQEARAEIERLNKSREGRTP